MSAPKSQTHKLRDVFEAKYSARLAAFQTMLKREQVLRIGLQDLRDKARMSNAESSVTMKSMGADVVWQSWIEQRSRQLNMELAQVLIQKEQYMHFLRADFGRKHASEELLRLEMAKLSRQKKKRAQDEILGHLVQRSSSGWS